MSDAMDRKEEKERTMTGRNKNMVCGALLCAMMLSMTACGNEIPDLREMVSAAGSDGRGIPAGRRVCGSYFVKI